MARKKIFAKGWKVDKGPLKGYTVKSVKISKVKQYSEYIDIVLDALGHPEAYVTDESTIWDFMLTKKTIADMKLKFKVPVSNKDYIWKIAERLEKACYKE